jgi:magnesium chelatase family protein
VIRSQADAGAGRQNRKPHPCGYYSHPRLRCRCSSSTRERYRARLSGPLLDRIDIHVTVPPVEVSALVRARKGESSATVRERVVQVRRLQIERARRLGLSSTSNAALSAADLERVVQLDDTTRKFLEASATRLGLSARAFTKILRVARTYADLEGVERVREGDVAEAVQGRVLDRAVDQSKERQT